MAAALLVTACGSDTQTSVENPSTSHGTLVENPPGTHRVAGRHHLPDATRQYRRFRAAIARADWGSAVRRRLLLPQVLHAGWRWRGHHVLRSADGAHGRRRHLLGAASHRAVCARYPDGQDTEHRGYHQHFEHRRCADRGDVRGPRLYRRRAELRGLRHFDTGLSSLPECCAAIG